MFVLCVCRLMKSWKDEKFLESGSYPEYKITSFEHCRKCPPPLPMPSPSAFCLFSDSVETYDALMFCRIDIHVIWGHLQYYTYDDSSPSKDNFASGKKSIKFHWEMMWVMLFTLGKSINRSGADETWDIIGVQHNIFHNFQKGYLLSLVQEKISI